MATAPVFAVSGFLYPASGILLTFLLPAGALPTGGGAP